jgi:hypothetical protein
LSACEGNIMEVQTDFKELLGLFNAHRVEYVIVGGYCLAFHGAPRYTGDLDILVKPERVNAGRILMALFEFGFGDLDLCEEDFLREDRVVQLGQPPVRVDLINSLTGVSWEQADAGKISGLYGDVHVFYLGREEFIANKRATGRKQDLADLERLEG